MWMIYTSGHKHPRLLWELDQQFWFSLASLFIKFWKVLRWKIIRLQLPWNEPKISFKLEAPLWQFCSNCCIMLLVIIHTQNSSHLPAWQIGPKFWNLSRGPMFRRMWARKLLFPMLLKLQFVLNHFLWE